MERVRPYDLRRVQSGLKELEDREKEEIRLSTKEVSIPRVILNKGTFLKNTINTVKKSVIKEQHSVPIPEAVGIRQAKEEEEEVPEEVEIFVDKIMDMLDPPVIEKQHLIPNDKSEDSSSGKAEVKSEEAVKAFSCHDCSFIGNTKLSLTSHKRKHKAVTLACPQCPYRTNRADYLKSHSFVHAESSNKLFACDQCTYRTFTARLLKRHSSSHSKYKRFSCPSCPYSTNRADDLKSHSFIHANVQLLAFACDQCSFKAPKAHLLKRHSYSHMEEKRFSCPLCTYKTNRADQLKSHSFVHAENKPFSCDQCPYQTFKASLLKRHSDRCYRKHNHSPSDSKAVREDATRNCYKPVKEETTSMALSQTTLSHIPSSSDLDRDKDNLKETVTSFSDTDNNLLKCSSCNFSTDDASYLARHKLYHIKI